MVCPLCGISVRVAPKYIKFKHTIAFLHADDEETHVLEHLGEYKNKERHVVMQK